MVYQLEPLYFQVGNCCDYKSILELETYPYPQPTLLQSNNREFLAQPMTELTSETYLQRLTTILNLAVGKFNLDWLSTPIIILLPQLGTIDNDQYGQLYKSVYRAIPDLKKHPSCYLFPYGRAAMLLAWRHIEIMLQEKNYSSVLVLAVDSDPRITQTQYMHLPPKMLPDESVPAAECVALVKFTLSDNGLMRHWFSYEGQVREKARGAAISALFERYQKAEPTPIHHFYAPYNGIKTLTEEWANVYHQLFPCVGKHTQVVMTGARTGELGACSGIYNILHFYERYKSGDYSHHTLQVESAEVLYRGAALYSWV
ncbi:hypothetical protein L4D09_19020 [Photobacterium makurazakiensis]|uniref:hypothetical protein n=1 Tax=Photobacterium makurazakiensis TaxID=2910234 RepID=UPI003D103A4A